MIWVVLGPDNFDLSLWISVFV